MHFFFNIYKDLFIFHLSFSIHLINMPEHKKNIIWNEFTESVYKYYYNTS